METQYNEQWFKQHALDSIKKMGEGVWDYSDSLLLYLPAGEEEYESIQKGDDPYAKLVTVPERHYLKNIAEAIVAELPDNFEFIDLGPGTAHKEQDIFDAARRAGKKFIYRPVDISPRYLQLAQEYAQAQGIEVLPLRTSFEELPELLGAPIRTRFVSLGLTFTNYEPQTILALLSRIAGKGGFVFVDVQLRDFVDMKQIQSLYETQVSGMFDPKLALLGVSVGDVAGRKVDDGIRAWYTLGKVPPELEKKGVRPGDTLFVFQSLRYTKEQFENELRGFTYKIFDMQSPFLGALIWTE
ncbi:hypothetical protein EXS62_01735 [Candidatus Kaiserbacteria bacterium]|nr:hypothetical protein [Candidatus Kaiserbacteria bacterium]